MLYNNCLICDSIVAEGHSDMVITDLQGNQKTSRTRPILFHGEDGKPYIYFKTNIQTIENSLIIKDANFVEPHN